MCGITFKKYTQNDEKIREIVKFIVIDLQPISIVEDSCFRRLIDYSTFTVDIEHLYENKRQICFCLESVDSMSITTDGWTSKYTADYYTSVTIHYINQDAELVSSLIKIIRLNNVAHTAENIAHGISETLMNWGLKSKCCAVVSDNAAQSERNTINTQKLTAITFS
jgi:hypothetical protein